MSDSWSKEDRAHYQSSEVMQELEKRVIDTIHRVDLLQEKMSNSNMEKEAVLGLRDVINQGQAAKRIMGEVIGLSKKMPQDSAHDEVADDESAEDGLVDDENNLQEEVVDDLRILAQTAIAEGNIKLAYKIERTIDEILEQDVLCK